MESMSNQKLIANSNIASRKLGSLELIQEGCFPRTDIELISSKYYYSLITIIKEDLIAWCNFKNRTPKTVFVNKEGPLS